MSQHIDSGGLTISQQTLTADQQTQVRNNLNAAKKDISVSKVINFNGLHSATTGVTNGLDAQLDAELATMANGDRRAFNLIPAGDSSFVGSALPFIKGRNNYGVLTKNTATYATYIGSDVSYCNLIIGARAAGGWTFRGYGTGIDITSMVTFPNGSAPANTKVYYCNSQVFIYYQGLGVANTSSDILFTLPETYRPPANIYIPFVKNINTYGTVAIASQTGICTVNQIGDETATGRIYFNASFWCGAK